MNTKFKYCDNCEQFTLGKRRSDGLHCSFCDDLLDHKKECKECRKTIKDFDGGSFRLYRWKDEATVGIIGCPKHISEISDLLDSIVINDEVKRLLVSPIKEL